MPDLARDLTVVFQEDRPGTLARAMEAIARAGINIEGYAEAEGVFHVLTRDPAATRQALQGGGFQVNAGQEALVLAVEDLPGAAAAVFRRIADAGVNVSFSYIAAKNRVVIGVDNLQKASSLFP